MSVTQAMRFLAQKKISHEVREYEHKEKGAEFAAEALGWPLSAMVKTLVANLSDGGFVLCLMPGDVELSLKKLARAAGVKSARMATVEEAERQTGYLVGGISPFGVKRPMKAWMHASIPALERIGINAGRRGAMFFMNPKDARDALGATVEDLSA